MASLFTNTTLSDEGIRSTIRLRGGLTAKHRVTAWKYIFRLPGNSTSFYDFLAIGPHPAAVSSLATRYPLRDRKLFRKMAVLISALAHWSPIWADAEFAMAWVFPFVVVFGQDDLGAFEAAMCFLLHWGSRLLITFPQPPVPVLLSMQLMLACVDRELAAHLSSLSVGALSYGWPLLRSAFSEVMCRDDWLRLMDRVLANAKKPELLEAAAVGFVVASRARLLSYNSAPEVEAYFRRPQPSVDLQKVFRVMVKVSSLGPPERWSRRDIVAALAAGGVAGRSQQEVGGDGNVDGTMAALELLRSSRQEFTPLPTGAYPSYDGFPHFVVNYQAELRERVAKQEREVEQRRHLVEELEERARSITNRERAMERETRINQGAGETPST